MQPKVKEALHNIWQAETRGQAYDAFEHCIERFSPKYPKAMDCLAKDKASMLAFYDYPAENWQPIRTTNPVESVFATVRLRTTKTKNCGSRATTLAMALNKQEIRNKPTLDSLYTTFDISSIIGADKHSVIEPNFQRTGRMGTYIEGS